MKLTARSELCRGHGLCYSLAPGLLEDDDDEGYVNIRGQVVDVPDGQVDHVRNAAASCPERALVLFEG